MCDVAVLSVISYFCRYLRPLSLALLEKYDILKSSHNVPVGKDTKITVQKKHHIKNLLGTLILA